MDELEISGKRYISTRRAAKEHNYHSDYIGQLIRGRKIEGQKVGRSWYVAADSLAEYFSNEGGAKVAPKAPPKIVPKVITSVAKAVEVTPEVAEEEVYEEPEEVADVEEVKEAEEVEKIISAPEPVVSEVSEEIEKEISIPIRKPQVIKEIPAIKSKSTLRYIADDTPLYPKIQQHAVPQIRIRPVVAPRVVEEVVEETIYVEEEPVTIIERPKPRRPINQLALRFGALLIVGAITAGITALASSYIISTTTVEGDTANVSYSLGGIE